MSCDRQDDDSDHPVAANDNGSANASDQDALRKVDEIALQLARIIGRRIAREEFAKMAAANDNDPEFNGENEPS